MIHFRKFNSRSNGSMKQHHAFSTEGKKTSSDCSNCGMKKKKTGNHNILQKASILCLLFFNGIAGKWHNQTAEQPSVWQTGMWNHSSLSAGWLSRAAHQNRSHTGVPLHLPLLRIQGAYMCGVLDAQTRLISWQRTGPSVQHSWVPPGWTAAGWMVARGGCDGRIVLRWRRNWLCLLGELHGLTSDGAVRSGWAGTEDVGEGTADGCRFKDMIQDCSDAFLCSLWN